jgi:iron complex outermembrane receptor protein
LTIQSRPARRLTRGLFAAALFSTVAGAALAQDAAPIQLAQNDAPASNLGSVIVTARRRAESAQDVPIALSVATGQTLEQTGVNNIVALPQIVPTIQVLSPNGRNTNLTIRGLGSSYGLANDGLEQGVGIYLDQVYVSRAGFATLDFVDIDRVEVLRGPQGTLFGKNTTAGALNITTLDATDYLSGSVEGTVGTYGLKQFKGTISGPLLGDTVTGRLSVSGTWRDGNLRNTVTGLRQNAQENKGVRGQIKIKPNDRLTIKLNGDYTSQQPECCTQVYVRTGLTQRPANTQYANLAAGIGYKPPSANPFDYLADVNDDIQADQWVSGLSGIVEYDFGPVTLTSVSAHREWDWEPRNDRDYTALAVTTKSANPSHQKQTSQEFRLSSNGRNTLDWTVGLYYFDQNVTTHGVTAYGKDASYWLLPGTNSPSWLLDGFTVFNDSSIDTTSYAAFGQVTWNLNDKLSITPGARYTKEKKDGAYAQVTAGGGATADATLINRRLGISRPQSFTAKTDDGAWSGQVAVNYKIAADLNSYVTYSRGFKSGGINMTALPLTAANTPNLTAAVVAPEKVQTVEAGLKSQLFDRLLTANLAVFNTQVRNFQANVVDSAAGAPLRGYLANVKEVRVRGAELDLSTRSIGGFTGYFNLAYTDGKYVDFKNAPTPLENLTATTSAFNLSGRDLPGVSRWAGSAGIEYRRPFTFIDVEGDAFIGVDANFRTNYYADVTTSKYSLIKGAETFNLRVGFSGKNGVDAIVQVKNLTNEHYLNNITIVSGNTGLVVGTPADERTINLTLRSHF